METYQWTITQNEPICQHWRLTRQPHTQRTSPIMSHNHRPLHTNSNIIPVDSIPRPHADNEIRQFIQHFRRGVFLQLVATSVAR